MGATNVREGRYDAVRTLDAIQREAVTTLCRLFHGYGATEGSLTLLLHPEDVLARPGSCGKPTLISDTRIVRFDGERRFGPDEVIPRNEVGQLIIRGPQVMNGYWNQPVATAQRLVPHRRSLQPR